MKSSAWQFPIAPMIMIILPLVSASASQKIQQHRGYSIPLIDLAAETERQVIVDKEPGQYPGHPTTVLLEDKKTIIARQ